MKEDILVVKNLIKYVNNTKILENVNFTMEKGKIYALVGKNGAGKTTLMKILAGLSFQSSGSIQLFGYEGELETARRWVGSLIENPVFYPYLTAKENLKLAQISHGILDEKEINEILKKMNFDYMNKKKVSNFSLGMKQKLGICMAMIHHPKLLILDEPTNGLDEESIMELRNVLSELVQNKRISILVSSHTLEYLQPIIDTYFYMDSGKIVETISKNEFEHRYKRKNDFKAYSMQPMIFQEKPEKYLYQNRNVGQNLERDRR